MARVALLLLLTLALTSAPRAALGEPEATPAPEDKVDFTPEPGSSDSQPDAPWCRSDIEALTPTMCHYSPEPPERAPDTLVIFLHGVIKYGTTWQYALQRGMQRAAKIHRFEVLIPRGRVGAGSKKFADHW